MVRGRAPATTLTAQGGAFALQQGAAVDIWPGGATALSLADYSHYMTFGKHAVELFGTPGATLPGWFRKYAWDVDVGFHPGGLFDVLENLALQVFQVPYRQFELKLSASAVGRGSCNRSGEP